MRQRRADSTYSGRGYDTFVAGKGDDFIFAQDYEDDSISGGDGTDDCTYDYGNGSPYDDVSPASCNTPHQQTACAGGHLFVAKVASSVVTLYKLSPTDGSTTESGVMAINGLGNATDVNGLAVKTDTCDLFAVLTYSGTQYLARFADPVTLSSSTYTSTSKAAITKTDPSNDPLVDLDFDAANNSTGSSPTPRW